MGEKRDERLYSSQGGRRGIANSVADGFTGKGKKKRKARMERAFPKEAASGLGKRGRDDSEPVQKKRILFPVVEGEGERQARVS